MLAAAMVMAAVLSLSQWFFIGVEFNLHHPSFLLLFFYLLVFVVVGSVVGDVCVVVVVL